MLRRKPVRQPGQDLRDVPIYTIPEAARFLAIPQRTLHAWFLGSGSLLKPSAKYDHGTIALLSFRDIAEAYVLEILRTVYGFPFQSLRKVVENAKDETTLRRPLIDADLRVVFRNLVLQKPARGKLPRRSVDLAHRGRNLVIPELVDIVGTRIPKDKQHMPYRLYPWRLLGPNDDSRPVTVDPDVMSGRAVVTGSRIPITLLLGMIRSGKTPEQIAKTYNLPVDVVRKALLHIEKPLQKVA